MNVFAIFKLNSILTSIADTRLKRVLWVIWFAVFICMLLFRLWVKDLTT